MLHASQLAKSYAGQPAVSQVSLTVAPGEILALLGPNGAGKSTTIGMIAGLIVPDTGDIRVSGQSMADAADACKARIGLVPQDIALFEELTGHVNLEIVGALYGLHGDALQKSINETLDLVGLTDRAADKVADYSGGMKRRLNIAAALLHDPHIVLLDEPTVGIDPQSRNAIFRNLESLKMRGKALIYSTHYMEEAERLADRIIIMDRGSVIATGTRSELERMLPTVNVLEVRVDAGFDHTGLATVTGVQGVESHDVDGGTRLAIALDSLNGSAARALAWVAEHGGHISHLAARRASLENLFLQMTGRALRD